MEDSLITSLLESVRAGLRADSFVQKVGMGIGAGSCPIKTLYNQIGTFKKDWKHWDALLSQSSFTFDQTGHPFAAKFRYQLLRAADTLRQLFSGYPATGSFVVTPEELVAGLVAGLATAEPAGETHRRRSSSSSVVVVVGPRSTAAAEKTGKRRFW
ncbi:hypothetical protein COCC4DRAFT_143487 [Bipolaris maydis ATCC 48331]|uniref:Uncharacterized protein n=2 Tax=Cochliobolus heterostrophus TaxID=5016 RepID=M2SMK3_COCH5|nr:uncharacterized protein COCC4DRAFT_143487 [Bipolaris maydis ATCC 48331]EMD86565.1 hypothetical protein COCHEDRAFT_1197993 [Bipolaris maydis C5]ENI02980.1 hypothetical protein COCC4DRAFT_143487 [Bipolaris maydis ATCC 48331]